MTRLLVDRFHSLGWTYTQGVCIRDAFNEFSLLHCSFAELAWRVCQAWGPVVSSAVSHRRSFQGLANSDFQATREFLRGLIPSDQGLFHKALNGAHFTNDMAYHYSDTGSLCCEFCNGPDSRFHRFWECPVFKSERGKCSEEFFQLLPTLPQSLTNHGWAVLPSTWKPWIKCLLDIELPPVEETCAPSPGIDQWMIVFTDGSCLWPRSKSLRLASWAIVQANYNGDPCSSQVVMAGAVPGVLQSTHRAELLAVLQTLRCTKFWGRSVRIWSDCEAVVNRVRKILAFREVPKINSPNSDLWLDIFMTFTECKSPKLQHIKIPLNLKGLLSNGLSLIMVWRTGLPEWPTFRGPNRCGTYFDDMLLR